MPETLFTHGITGQSDTLISCDVKNSGIPMNDEVPKILVFMQQMAATITKTTSNLDPGQISAFFQMVVSAKRVYVAGAGRSGFIAKAFGLRLLHLGYDVYVVGETITPALRAGDTMVVFSGSGETHSMVSIAGMVKDLGGTVGLITASSDSKISKIADCIVNLGDLTGYYRKYGSPFEVRQLTGEYRSVSTAFAPLGTLFETLALVFSDAVISELIVVRKSEISDMQRRLANTE
jgi:6-phospho-3-hexuloisomerase